MKKAFLYLMAALVLAVACEKDPAKVDVTTVTLDKTELSLAIGEEATLVATVLPEDATAPEVTWTSSDAKVATVEAGKVKAIASGKATIKATADGITAECKVTVEVTYTAIEGPANCYVVKPNGNYSIDATVRGNGAEGILPSFANHANGITSATIDPVEAAVLWAFPEDHVTDAKIEDGRLCFSVGRGLGNAVVAAKDANGNILWSWHIWASDEVKDLTVTVGDMTWKVMDRNLGATSLDLASEDSYGMFFAWGRKDPFTHLGFDGSDPYQYVIASNEGGTNNTIAYSVAHPDEWIAGYLYGSGDQNSWVYSADAEGQKVYSDLWGDKDERLNQPAQKTIYDPCPAGYCVATPVMYAACKDNGGSWAETENGLTVITGFELPNSGMIHYGGGWWHDGRGYPWTSSAAWGGNDMAFRILGSDARDQTGRARGMAIRCQKLQ